MRVAALTVVVVAIGIVVGCGHSTPSGVDDSQDPPPDPTGDAAAATDAKSRGADGGVRLDGSVDSSACAPGQQTACPCAGGGAGVQVCAANGTSYGACVGCAPLSADGGTCTKLTCDDAAARYAAIGGSFFYICGATADGCGGVIQCSSACAYGTCAPQPGGQDFCSCGRGTNPADDQTFCTSHGRPPHVVACYTGFNTNANASCVQLPGLPTISCCP
jgi:hypothetical protein